MLSKSLLSLAITASLVGMSGCNISSTTDSASATPQLQKEQAAAEIEFQSKNVTPIFNPVMAELPLGIDLIFAKASATDGTADVGIPAGNPVLSALNDMAGGISTLAPIDIAMSGSIDPATVTAAVLPSVWLVKLPNAEDVKALAFPDVGGGYNIGTTDDPKILSAKNYDALDVTHAGALLTKALYSDSANYDAAVAVFAAENTALQGKYERSVLSIDGGTDNLIRISPTKPLDAKTKYIVIVTNGVTSKTGTAIVPSPDYSSIKNKDGLATSDLLAVSAAINGWEGLAMGFIGGATADALTTDNVAISSAFTTVDPKTVLTFMANPDVFVNAAAGADIVSSSTDLQALLSTIKPTARTFELIKNAGGDGVHQIPVAKLTDNPLTEAFDPKISDNVLISQGGLVLPQYTVSLATDPQAQWVGNTSVGAALDPTGNTPPKDVDGTHNVTHRWPLAQKQRDSVVPLMMFEPIPTDIATYLASVDNTDGTSAATYESTGPNGTKCGTTQPVAGWPVVIMQHGFTSDRSGNIINASKVADLTCSVVIAMDLPHHGVAADSDVLGLGVDYIKKDSETSYPFAYAKSLAVKAATDGETLDETILDSLSERHESLYLDSSTGAVLPMDFANATGDSGSLWIRLDNFQRTRDNMRQGVMDLLNLNASLANIDVDGDGNTPDLNVDNVSFIGHSLGAMEGTVFVAINNAAVNTYGNSNLKTIKKAVLATSGGHLTKVIENSVAFSAKVLTGLQGNDASLVQGNSNLDSYMKVFQATIDSADPMNFIGDLKAGSAADIPVLMVGMYGNGTTNPSDLVVPTNGSAAKLADSTDQAPTSKNPLTGLDPMLSLIGAENVKDAPTGNKLIAKYNVGGHSTFSSAGSRGADAPHYDSQAAFAEMLTQTVTFLLTGSVTSSSDLLISDTAE